VQLSPGSGFGARKPLARRPAGPPGTPSSPPPVPGVTPDAVVSTAACSPCRRSRLARRPRVGVAPSVGVVSLARPEAPGHHAGRWSGWRRSWPRRRVRSAGAGGRGRGPALARRGAQPDVRRLSPRGDARAPTGPSRTPGAGASVSTPAAPRSMCVRFPTRTPRHPRPKRRWAWPSYRAAATTGVCASGGDLRRHRPTGRPPTRTALTGPRRRRCHPGPPALLDALAGSPPPVRCSTRSWSSSPSPLRPACPPSSRPEPPSSAPSARRSSPRPPCSSRCPRPRCVGTDGSRRLDYCASPTSRPGSHAGQHAPGLAIAPASRPVHAPPHTSLDHSHESGVAPLHSFFGGRRPPGGRRAPGDHLLDPPGFRGAAVRRAAGARPWPCRRPSPPPPRPHTGQPRLKRPRHGRRPAPRGGPASTAPAEIATARPTPRPGLATPTRHGRRSPPPTPRPAPPPRPPPPLLAPAPLAAPPALGAHPTPAGPRADLLALEPRHRHTLLGTPPMLPPRTPPRIRSQAPDGTSPDPPDGTARTLPCSAHSSRTLDILLQQAPEPETRFVPRPAASGGPRPSICQLNHQMSTHSGPPIARC
jgi:hypothetical protein